MSNRSYSFEHCGQISSTSAYMPELIDREEGDLSHHIWPNHYERELFSCHNHPDDWLKIKEGPHSALSANLYPKASTAGTPSWGLLSNIIKPKRRFTDLNNTVCVTAITFDSQCLIIGTQFGILRLYDLEDLKPKGDDYKLDSPIFEINSDCAHGHMIIRAGRELFHLNRFNNNLSPISALGEEYYIAIFPKTCFGNFVLSQEGNLYSLKIKGYREEALALTKFQKGLVKNVLRATHMDLEQRSEDEPDKGFLIGITCCSEVVLIRVFKRTLTPEELEFRTNPMTYEIILRLDASMYAGGVRLVLLKNRLLLTSELPKRVVLDGKIATLYLEDIEFYFIDKNVPRPFENLTRKEVSVPLFEIRGFERMGDHLLMVFDQNVVIIYYAHNLSKFYIVQLPYLPDKVYYYIGFLVIVYHKDLIQIKSIVTERRGVCNHCEQFFKDYLDYNDVSRTKFICKCHFN